MNIEITPMMSFDKESTLNYEYTMSATLAQELLKKRKGEDKKKEPQKYLCDYINSTVCARGVCVGVKITK